ncbi:MAG: DNA translocase FtsK [Spirochaetales bacterium]|nr:DNA translocase FtsK [Spirochaetales bacterium]
MNKKASRLIAAAVIAVAGIYLLIVLLNSMRPVIPSGFLLLPGKFLYSCFMEASFFLPLLLLISSFLLFIDLYNSSIFAVKILSLLPFFTFSLLLKILNYVPGSRAADSIINSLGFRGGSTVLGLLLIFEVLLIIKILAGEKASAKGLSLNREEISEFSENSTEEIEAEVNNEESSVEIAAVDDLADSVESETSGDTPEHSFEPVPMGWINKPEPPESKNKKIDEDEQAAFEEQYSEKSDETVFDEDEAPIVSEYEDEYADNENLEEDISAESFTESDSGSDGNSEGVIEDSNNIISEDSVAATEEIDDDVSISEPSETDETEIITLEENAEQLPSMPVAVADDEVVLDSGIEENIDSNEIEEKVQEQPLSDSPIRGDEQESAQAAMDVWDGVEPIDPEDEVESLDELEDEVPVEEIDHIDDSLEEEALEADAPDLGLSLDLEELSEDTNLSESDDSIELEEAESNEEVLDGDMPGEAELEEVELGEVETEEVELEEDEPEEDELEDDELEDDELEEDELEEDELEDVSESVLENSLPTARPKRYEVPSSSLLKEYDDNHYWVIDEETRQASIILQETLKEFKIDAEVTGISRGPVITMFEILPAPGVKLSKIVNLADNIALGLAASRVRIVAPIPGKHAVGIEVPNKDRAIVSFKEILESEELKNSKMAVPVVLGKDITGGSRIIDLVQTPHLLIAGATGSGKSVCVNSLICSILYSRTPNEVKMIMIDPKIVELKLYNDIPHLLTPVITEPKKAFQALQYTMSEMERRYSLLNALGVRDIKSYNRKIVETKMATEKLPYIVVLVDEFADLMATTGKELENVISRLTAMSRAVGIHLVLATQRPSVDVITGLIKANIPSRIAFMVASKTDSRIILDAMGADKLLGKGDMLFTSAWDPNPSRIQGAFLSDDEVENVTDHVKTLGEPDYIDDEIFISEDDGDSFELESQSGGDPLMESAVSIVVEAGKASASYLQRRLKIGYNRAARLVEEMEDRGIVGPANGSKPREILHIPDKISS